METAPKFYVVAERYNPQLGTYLAAVYVGKRKENKNTVSCVFDYYGSKKSLKFEKNPCGAWQLHYFAGKDNCVYGSMSYFAFDTPELAKAYLEGKWGGKDTTVGPGCAFKLEECLEKIQKSVE